MLQALAGDIISQIDLDDHRKARKKKPICVTFAAEEAANKAGRLATTTDLQCRYITSEVTV